MKRVATVSASEEAIEALNAKTDVDLVSLKEQGLADKLGKLHSNGGLPKSKRKAGATF